VFAVVSPFRLRVSQHLDHATFPVPATSNAACVFPALRSPVCFAPRQRLCRRPAKILKINLALGRRTWSIVWRCQVVGKGHVINVPAGSLCIWLRVLPRCRPPRASAQVSEKPARSPAQQS
jgi:hypothetical protein